MLGDRPASERGQLLVITALVLAVVLVGLALVLNSAIYTENLSTRQSTDSVGVTTAIGTGEAEIERAIHHVNRHNNSSNPKVNRAFDDAIRDLNNDTNDEYAKRGTSYRFQVTDRTNGTHLKHTNSSKSFVSGGSNSGQGDWLLAGSVPHLRDYRMTVQPRYLYTGSDLTIDILMNNAFRVNMTGEDQSGSEVTWEVYVYENDTGDVVVVGANETELLSEDTIEDLTTFEDGCRAVTSSDDEDVTLDFTNGTVSGQSCSGLAFQDHFEGPISIRYENADDNETLAESRSGGTYELAIGTTDYEDQHFHNATEDQSPYATHIIYSARVESHYARADITHSRTMRLYPGIETYVG
ncbi:hypothetical protein HWV23_09235 [Natronomonas halophila]|uniref:DUF7261 family protein n=1 Tax=Natronomonas halophila TaxID=2747817 RepID=UPI0015B6CBDE|nr:hypothetical protein [Natronomonas halophila]QLD85900.1 hypothetical protein HWV23_09235 [Natronomonas halophila]